MFCLYIDYIIFHHPPQPAIISPMEQTPWKPILFAALGSFVLLFVVYFFALPKQDLPQKTDKILTFDSSSITGRKDGKKIWEFSAAAGWVGENGDITNLKEIKSGTFYKNGEPLIKNFTAEAVAASRASKLVEAKNAAADIAITGKNKRKFARIRTDYFKYDPNREYSYLAGGIRLIEKKTTLFSDAAEIDHNKGIASLSKNISIKRKDISLNCEKMTYAADNEEIFAEDNIRASISGKEITRIKANSLKMYVDEAKNVEAKGSIEAIQGKKAAIAEEAIYNETKKTIILSRKVETVIKKGRALIKEETARQLNDKKVKGLLEEKTLQYSDTLILSTISGDYKASGNIIVKQKGPSRQGLAEAEKEAKADRADYSDRHETITLTGDVYLKEKERWVKCQKVVVSVKDKTFEAIGKVEAEFKI